MKNAIISVYDKTGIVDFAKELNKIGFNIISTGGTLKKLKNEGLTFIKCVSEVTKFPEILDGKIKTLHPRLLGGILAHKDNEEQMKEIEKLEITPVDLVICNFYPFGEVVNKGTDLKTALENIDIGGPNIIRAAAKNFENVIVIVNPKRYKHVLEELKKNGDVSNKTKKTLAIEAFKETSKYDMTIYRFLKK
ncbi:IMP cyclohydrolase [Candidatus Bathyarchaeota archaeon]|nr:IMP cyclohydrolase [Candidatus Bathyarchaeota archaeon]